MSGLGCFFFQKLIKDYFGISDRPSNHVVWGTVSAAHYYGKSCCQKGSQIHALSRIFLHTNY